MDGSIAWFDNDLLRCLTEGKNSEAISIIEIHAQSRDSTDQFRDYRKRTLLHHAVKSDNPVIAQYRIHRGCDVEATDNDGETPLTMALKLGNVNVIPILLDAKKGYFKLNDHIRMTARRFPSDMKLVKLLLDKVTKGCRDNNDVVEKLLQANCPLAAVVLVFKNIELTKLMLEGGCSVDSRLPSTGETALHAAVEYLDIDVVKLLVEQGADINAADFQNCTPISRFKMYSDDTDEKLEILRILLDRGTSLSTNFSSRRDCYWLLYGVDPSITVMTKLLYEADNRTLRILLPCIDFCRSDASGKTPLHYLAANENAAVLEVLKGKNFDINARDCYGCTPLDVAIRREYFEKAHFLLENGANPNNIDNNGDFALKHMLRKLSESKEARNFIEHLLIYGADTRLLTRNRANHDLVTCSMKRDLDFAKLLLAHLANLESSGEPRDEFLDNRIKCNNTYEEYFLLCKRQIEKMKMTTVYESVALYKLFHESPNKLAMYARNEEFRLNYEYVKRTNYNMCSYYEKLLAFRTDKAIKIAKVKNETVIMVCQITGLPITISSSIVDYLSQVDYENLSQI